MTFCLFVEVETKISKILLMKKKKKNWLIFISRKYHWLFTLFFESQHITLYIVYIKRIYEKFSGSLWKSDS
jgi:hypothetical protein